MNDNGIVCKQHLLLTPAFCRVLPKMIEAQPGINVTVGVSGFVFYVMVLTAV